MPPAGPAPTTKNVGSQVPSHRRSLTSGFELFPVGSPVSLEKVHIFPPLHAAPGIHYDWRRPGKSAVPLALAASCLLLNILKRPETLVIFLVPPVGQEEQDRLCEKCR